MKADSVTVHTAPRKEPEQRKDSFLKKANALHTHKFAAFAFGTMHLGVLSFSGGVVLVFSLTKRRGSINVTFLTKIVILIE